MSTPTYLEKQILATIVYYDILDYPLTRFEVFLYLVRENRDVENKTEEKSKPGFGYPKPGFDFSSVLSLLNTSQYLKEYLGQKQGFYFLKKIPPAPLVKGGEVNIVQLRLNRKKIWDQKWKKAKKIFWIMQIIPFSKLVMGSGSFSLGNTRKDSDVDLLIIAKKGRIWTARTFFTLLTSLLGVRRYKDKTEDKICLNHYITDKSLRIPFESIYTAHLYCHILSVYDSKEDRKLFKKFQKENEWMKKYLQNYEFSNLEGLRSIKRNKILKFISNLFEFVLSGRIGDYFEKIMSEIQTKRIKKDSINIKKGGRITISNDQLEFHPNSHEANIIPEFNKRMKELNLFEFSEQKDSGLT